ncbi:MAG TPA: histidine kinase dimerization/phospho-acceptor domain-containing protein, partial [Candidatus Acidoferrum sp.]|nr:histidine kinase dimerization/phospho-acceptor domain-containing protein [Candidatus Acidoferrum sp.]
MKNRIFFKLLAVFLIVIAATATILDVMLSGAWESSMRSEIERNLTQKTLLFAHRVETDRNHTLAEIAAQEGQAAGARATIIDASGKVLADSESNPAGTENDGTRPEFATALGGKTGESERRSATLGVPFLYVAVPISGGAVRLAYPLSDVEAVQAQVRHRLLWGSVLALFIALIIAASASVWTSRRLERIVDVAARIEQGDLHARVEDSPLDEIGRVAAAIDKTAGQVERSFAAVRSSQRQLETLLNSMQDAVIAISSDGLVQWANQPMDRLVPQHTRLNAPVVETIRDPDFLAAVKAATTTKQVKTTRATSIVPGRAYDVTAAPLPDGGAVAVLRDLTETERVEKTRRDFIANVSHELRTPLTSIQGYSETLLDLSSENAGPNREFLEIIRKNAARMARLTEDLLTLARVESGETRFDTEPVPPIELLHDAEESFREIARGQEVELQIVGLDTPETGGKNSSVETLPVVRADREAIHQVFSNLIDNAMKYGRAGRRILLGARPGRRGVGVEFYVQDFGAGIASEHLPRLFERFYRVDKARSRESGGTGLGLAIA